MSSNLPEIDIGRISKEIASEIVEVARRGVKLNDLQPEIVMFAKLNERGLQFLAPYVLLACRDVRTPVLMNCLLMLKTSELIVKAVNDIILATNYQPQSDDYIDEVVTNMPDAFLERYTSYVEYRLSTVLSYITAGQFSFDAPDANIVEKVLNSLVIYLMFFNRSESKEEVARIHDLINRVFKERKYRVKTEILRLDTPEGTKEFTLFFIFKKIVGSLNLTEAVNNGIMKEMVKVLSYMTPVKVGDVGK